MIEDPLGCLEYDEKGSGPAILFVPGSCSTGAAWRGVIGHLEGDFRAITTSLPGYGKSAERRTAADRSIGPLVAAIEAVVRHAGTPVHLVGHSFGGEVALAVALRRRVPLESLAVLEAPAPNVLRAFGHAEEYGQFRSMTDTYFAAVEAGEPEAIGAMIDFYGGPGTFASWPQSVRSYAARTTATNVLDWQGAYALEYGPGSLAGLGLPVLVAVGEASHPAVKRSNALIAAAIPGAAYVPIAGASHFMIATHPKQVADLVRCHVSGRQGPVDR